MLFMLIIIIRGQIGDNNNDNHTYNTCYKDDGNDYEDDSDFSQTYQEKSHCIQPAPHWKEFHK